MSLTYRSIETCRSSARQRGGQLVAVGHGQHRVAGRDEQRPQLAPARRGDLLAPSAPPGSCRARRESRRPARAAWRTRRGRSGRRGGRARAARAEHRAAGPVEVAGHDVQRVQQERHQRAVPAQARTGPPVRRRAAGRGQVPREVAYGPGGHAACDPRSARAGGPRPSPAARPGRAPAGRARRVSSSPSAKITWRSESSSQASPSGRTGRCSNARAVSVRRGSTTTTRPPRRTIALSWSLIRGALTSAAVGDQRVRADDQQEVGTGRGRGWERG